ncbi:MAG: dihydropteroate synthase [Thermoflexales bacterium]|nr:dihydropteroate synthase [Thermoflexales bacterium]
MYIIGENIHIIAPKVKQAFIDRDAVFLMDVARRQVEAGASALDLNVGPQKKAGPEIMSWLVDVVQEGVGNDVPLSLDTTNLAAIEAGLQKIKPGLGIINSASAEEERLEKVPPVAAQYNARLVVLTMGKSGIPVSAEARVSIFLEAIMPRLEEVGLPLENVIVDPLVLTVSGCQEYVPECIEAVRILKNCGLPCTVSVGLSNVSNAVPAANRPLLNRVYMVMLMAAGLDAVIADPLDSHLLEFIRVIEQRDDSTALNRLLLKLYDKTAAVEEVEPGDVEDMNDLEQAAIWKTIRVLLNKTIYADAYLTI